MCSHQCWVWPTSSLGCRHGSILCAAGQRGWPGPFAAPTDCPAPVWVLGRDSSFPFCSLVWLTTSLWKVTAAFCTFSLFPAPPMLMRVFHRSCVTPANNLWSVQPRWAQECSRGTEPRRFLHVGFAQPLVQLRLNDSTFIHIWIGPTFTNPQIWRLVFCFLWLWESFPSLVSSDQGRCQPHTQLK